MVTACAQCEDSCSYLPVALFHGNGYARMNIE
jgi:hypothetical protein